jgi:hypothetical protein
MLMKNNFKILLAITSLALAALACQALSGTPTTNSTPDIAPADTSAPDVNVPPAATQTENPTSNDSDVLMDDDFSNSRIQWGTGTDADSGVEYKDEALNFQVFTKNYIVWTTPNDKDYENIHMEVTVINNGTDSTTAFGFFCDKQYPIDDSRYYFAVTPAGQYAIAKAALALDDVFLTNNDEWADSDLIAKDASSYRLGADCGNGKLTLYVDGQQIASVDDSTYTSGGIALFAWSGKDATTTNVSFDDFHMTQLP